jgi:anthranilate phosphoribosyltransferase
MDIKQALNLLVNRQSLSSTQMQEVMRHLMSGECSASQIAGFLVALRMKGESLDEVE